MDPSQNRRDVRARVSVPIFLLRRGESEPVRMIDASYRGLFVRMKNPPPVRELLKLRVELPTRNLIAHGVVTRIVEDQLGHAGVGLRFFALTGQDRLDWEQFIGNVLVTRIAA
jgi:hypothetical protein